ncbi:MAG: acetyl-CoA C-acyltransferase, partial [Candidatus Methylomirabilis sp.]|nr:acetyl-CoA C-acyltransferase [Deltaproteobacteria bacterium]
MSDAYIVSACRTAIGGFGGPTKDVPLGTLGATVMKEALARAGADKGELDEVVMGCVLTATNDLGPARIAEIEAGIPDHIPAFTVNKACGSGLKAVALAAQAIQSGDAEMILAGGMESMNRVPYALVDARWGYRMGNNQVYDLLVGGLTCPITKVHMGVTAENVAERHKISRQEQDEFAAMSYEKALKAIQSGKFKQEIVPLAIPQKRGDPLIFDTDGDPKPTPLD